MTTITLQDIRSRGSKAIPTDHACYLIVNSKPRTVMLPVDLYEALIDAFEELEDRKAIEERKNEPMVKYKDVFPA